MLTPRRFASASSRASASSGRSIVTVEQGEEEPLAGQVQEALAALAPRDRELLFLLLRRKPLCGSVVPSM